MRAYVFPGQGSQKKGMGKELFEEFSDLTLKADEILGYSIKELCINDPEQKLNQTQFTQPALFTVSAFSYLKKMKDTGVKPEFLAGHSLGEYNALHAAGVFSFETGLNLVKKRGELMSYAQNGAMAAIINCSEQQIWEILKDANLMTIDIANYNSPSQIIITGLKDDVSKAQQYFEKVNARFIPLNTSGAFHSRYMKPAAEKYDRIVSEYAFLKPEIPVIANVSALPYGNEMIAKNLVDQMYKSVRWTDSVLYLLDAGVTDFEEFGVGDVLTKLINGIKKVRAPDQIANQVSKKQKKELMNENWNYPRMEKDKTESSYSSVLHETRNDVIKFGAWSNGMNDVREIVNVWNKRYPVGTKVRSPGYDSQLETRTEAMVLFDCRAAVYIKNYNGYFDIQEIEPI